MANFYKLAGFPKVVGAIDGSLIAIRAPQKDEHLYVCHKGFHAINVMAVCNTQLQFTNVVAKWQGAVHDSGVFNVSLMKVHLESGGGRDGWLLGDRGYGIFPYLLTPFRPSDITTRGQAKYQKAHTTTRNTIERAFGLWKSRFRCIDASGGAMQLEPEKCCQVIMATAVLHNMAVEDKTPLPDLQVAPLQNPIIQPSDLDEDSNDDDDDDVNDGSTIRDQLIQDIFS